MGKKALNNLKGITCRPVAIYAGEGLKEKK